MNTWPVITEVLTANLSSPMQFLPDTLSILLKFYLEGEGKIVALFYLSAVLNENRSFCVHPAKILKTFMPEPSETFLKM